MSGVAEVPRAQVRGGVAAIEADRASEGEPAEAARRPASAESASGLARWLRGDGPYRGGRPTRVTVAAETPEGPQELDPARLATLGILLGGVIDPMTAVMGLQSMIRDAQSELRSEGVASAQGRAETENAERAQQLEAARKQLEKVKSMPGWLRKVIGAVLSVVGAVAAAFTGGAGAALTVIGIVLLAAGDIVQWLGHLGVIDENVATLVAAGLKLVGAIVLTVAGGAGAGELSSSVQQVGQVLKQVKQIAETAVATAEASMAIRNHGLVNSAENHQANAAENEVTADEAFEMAGDELEFLKRLMQMFQRVQRRVHEASRAQHEGMLVAARALA